MNKFLGYAITAIGAIGFALTFQSLRDTIKLTLPSAISELYLTISSLVVLAIGLFIIVKSDSPSSKQPEEIPIYEGQGKHRKLVGIQRVGKK